MLIYRHVRILEKHVNILFPSLNIRFYVSRRSKYVNMGLDCALFTLKDHSNILMRLRILCLMNWMNVLLFVIRSWYTL